MNRGGRSGGLHCGAPRLCLVAHAQIDADLGVGKIEEGPVITGGLLTEGLRAFRLARRVVLHVLRAAEIGAPGEIHVRGGGTDTDVADGTRAGDEGGLRGGIWDSSGGEGHRQRCGRGGAAESHS